MAKKNATLVLFTEGGVIKLKLHDLEVDLSITVDLPTARAKQLADALSKLADGGDE